MSTLTKVAEFTGTRDFEAAALAEAWCMNRGVSIGPLQRGAARGLMRGDVVISKWRNMTDAERNQLDGRMTGDMRTGPVEIWMRDDVTPERESGYVASIHGHDGSVSACHLMLTAAFSAMSTQHGKSSCKISPASQ